MNDRRVVVVIEQDEAVRALLRATLGEAGFEVRSMVDVDQHPPDGWHWEVVATTAPGRRAGGP